MYGVAVTMHVSKITVIFLNFIFIERGIPNNFFPLILYLYNLPTTKF